MQSHYFMASIQPQPYIASINIYRTWKMPNTGSHIASFGHMKILYTLVAMGSAALAAAVFYPGKATRTSRKGQ